MKTEEIKDNETKARCIDFACCGPDNFKEMFEKMSKCFSGQSVSTDFSSMKSDMMKKMMEMSCLPKTTETREDTEIQKEHEGETGFAEKESCIS